MSKQLAREELQEQFEVWNLFKLHRPGLLRGARSHFVKLIVFEFVLRRDIDDSAVDHSVVSQKLYACRGHHEFREILRSIDDYRLSPNERMAINVALTKAYTVVGQTVLDALKKATDSSDESPIEIPESEQKMCSVD